MKTNRGNFSLTQSTKKKMGCSDWGEANHTYFQMANLFLALTYFVPNTLKGLIVMRLFLGSAGLCFTMWATIILCSPDTFAWNFIFMIINFAHVLYLLYTMRPIKFQEEHEVVYGNMFEPLGVARWQYKPIAMFGQKEEWGMSEVIAAENVTLCEHLSILTSGSARVIKNGKFLHRIKAYEFINSPEWLKGTQSGGALPISYEVSIISESCVVVSWKRNKIRSALRKGTFLKNIFGLVIGQDVTNKLFDVNNAKFTNDETTSGKINIVYNMEDNISRRSYSRIYDTGMHELEVHHSAGNHAEFNKSDKNEKIIHNTNDEE